mgnify:CR=1 FL=1
MITFHSPVLFVRDIERSKEFYKTLLHQKIEHDFGKNVIFESGLTIWEIDPGHEISRSTVIQNDSNRFELYFETETIEEVQLELEQKDTRFLHKIQEEPWGQQTLRFFDPDHHLIEVGEPLEVFVKRMSQEGLSHAAISRKTGIPVKTVETLLDNSF